MKLFHRLRLLVAAALVVGANLAYFSVVHATGNLSHLTVAESNMPTSGTSEVAVEFTTSASNTGTGLTVSFTGWTGGSSGSVNATQSVTNGCAAFPGLSGANLPGTPAASGSGATITFSGLSAYSANTAYCVTLTGTTGSSNDAVTNPTSANQYGVVVTGGSDSATTAEIDVISSDQYTVSASVSPTFTMTSPANDSFGTLTSSSLNNSGGTATTITTNAKNGWFLWAEDANAGLRSATQSKTIASVSTGSNANLNTGGSGPGNEAYALGVTSTNSTANYDDHTASGHGSGLSSSAFNEIATETGPTAGSAVNLKELANIAGNTPAAPDYADTITLVGAGSF